MRVDLHSQTPLGSVSGSPRSATVGGQQSDPWQSLGGRSLEIPMSSRPSRHWTSCSIMYAILYK
ncbi:UNVERIFIED_ORG: hypothetical protein ABIC72_003932 [Burkholderia sp. 1988]|nr:hypothetical protein [Paraburkholderia terricola]